MGSKENDSRVIYIYIYIGLLENHSVITSTLKEEKEGLVQSYSISASKQSKILSIKYKEQLLTGGSRKSSLVNSTDVFLLDDGSSENSDSATLESTKKHWPTGASQSRH